MTEMITHPKLLFDASAIERIRRNIETYDWVRRLFEKLKHAVDGSEECFTSGAGRFTLTRPPAELSAFPAEGMTRGAEGVHQSRLSEMAMVGVLSGDRRYAQRFRYVLAAEPLGLVDLPWPDLRRRRLRGEPRSCHELGAEGRVYLGQPRGFLLSLCPLGGGDAGREHVQHRLLELLEGLRPSRLGAPQQLCLPLLS